MKNNTTLIIMCLLLAGFLAVAGCSKYADPELKITNTLTKISEDPITGNITYDVSITVANIGQNNAYKVNLLTILSTPKDLPEYRFTNKNFNVGEVEKGKSETVSEHMILPTTKTNYDLIISGSREPEVDTKVSSVSSNMME
ncbi:MAG: hypothetical protein V1862_12135 [Methanobacteriota archaeon]